MHCPVAVLAANPDERPAGVFDQAYALQVVGSLILVFICLFGLLALIKKMDGFARGDQQSLQVVSSLKVGNREKILLLEVGQEQLLVGVAPGSVRALHVLAAPMESTGPGAAGKRDFASLLPSGSGPGAGG